MFTAKSLWVDVYSECKKLGACVEGPDKFFNPYIEKNPEITFDEIADICISTDPRTADPGWYVWTYLTIKDKCDAYMRRKLLMCIKDPAQAFNIYITLIDISDEEDAILVSKFGGKVPTMETELSTKVVKRQKNIYNNTILSGGV